MNGSDRQPTALQIIFSFFLGLMVVAFAGVGVNTYYPGPSEKYNQARQELSRRQESLSRKAAPGSYSPREQAQLDSLSEAQGKLGQREQAEFKGWARTTGIVLVLFATLVLVVSLVLSERLRVISNGLLLGGLFTMIYGVGWAIFSGNSATRFWVITFALAVALGHGYAKFVRGRRKAGESATQPERAASLPAGASFVASAGAAPPAESALQVLSERLDRLEERAAAAAAAWTGGETERRP
jgi:hypothetical protein